MGQHPCVSLNHRTIDWFRLEGTCRDHLVQSSAKNSNVFSQIRVLKTPFSQTLNVSRAATSSENLRVHLISLSVPAMKTPLIILHLVTETLLSPHWMWPSSQFPTQIQGPDFTLCLTHIPEECKLHQCVITAVQTASSLVTDQFICADLFPMNHFYEIAFFPNLQQRIYLCFKIIFEEASDCLEAYGLVDFVHIILFLS